MMHRWQMLTPCVIVLMSQVACGSHDPARHSAANPDLVDPEAPLGAAGAGGEAASGENSTTGGASDNDDSEDANVAGGDYCIISADCGSGEFCELGECVSACENDADCRDGFECSKRGRCIEHGADDSDPPPITEKLGTVAASPTSFQLDESDTEIEITLTTDADEPLPYRVELFGPHLSMDDPRGEIDGAGTLSIHVDPNAIENLDAFGTIHIFTELGNLVVDAPIRVGMTGNFQGVLRYDSAAVPFGNASMNLQVQEHHGDVELRVDPTRSLLFPSTLGVATGRGLYTVSDGLEFTITQRIDPSVGGVRNHLQRPIGRTLNFALDRTVEGNWEGVFEERIYGLLPTPVTLQGDAFFARATCTPKISADGVAQSTACEPNETFELGELDDMPGLTVSEPNPDAIFGWSWDSCESAARLAAGCSEANINLSGCLGTTLEQVYYQPMLDALQANLERPTPLSDLRDRCEREMFSTSALGPQLGCAAIPPLACGLRSLASLTSPTTEQVPETFSRLYARTLVPALFVAQDHIVEGFRESLIEGRTAQAEHYEKAREALDKPLTWLLHPILLKFLVQMPANRAAGDPNAVDPTARNYPALRALSRAFYVNSLLDAEQARLATTDRSEDPEEQRDKAQTSALLSFLDAAALTAVLQSWGSPPEVGSELLGFLSELDSGFSAMAQGALTFGVPDGEISFVYDPQRGQPTNFEQILLHHAAPTLAQFKADERSFVEAERAYENNQEALERELEQVRTTQDESLRSICGSGFDPDAIDSPEDWINCGADGGGQIAELSLDIEQAHLRLQAAEGRVLAANRKIDIDRQRLADTQGVHQETLRFIDRTGTELEGLIVQEGIINAVQATMQMAAESSLFNAGAPAAMAPAMAVIEGMRTQINVARNRLQTAKEMRFEEAGAEIELINGMAEIQRQLVDVAQLELEIAQEGLAVAQANLRRDNALGTAKRIHLERQRTLSRILDSSAADPLHRVLQDRLALAALDSRATAQRWLYRAGRALEYEINTPLGDSLGRAVLGAFNSQEIDRLSACYQTIFSEYTSAFGIPQEFSTRVSLREMLGVLGPRTDAVTGQELTEAELFRRSLLQNQTIDRDGNVQVQFSTNLMPGNGLWSTNVCDDKIASVKAQLVGDFQGDDEAVIEILVEGASIMRRCDSEEVVGWDLKSPSKAVIQAGVNHFGPVASTSLFGQSVARASWTLIIPSGLIAPQNDDLDLEHLDDIVLEISHRALPRLEGGADFDVSCLGSVGAGG